MSGGALAFQKLNGEGTEMDKLIKATRSSDLYKMAKEFAPNVNLIPVTKSWEIPINENAVNDLALGGLYFGKWILNHNSQDVGNNDNSRKRSQAFLKYAGDVVARTMIIVHGDDILSWGTQTTKHYGFATSLHVHKLEVDDQPQHGVQVSFIGYKISNDAGFVFPAPVVTPNIGGSGNTGLTAQDLTNAGYTYQWNVTAGVGTFTDPHNPNTQFVPDGNGNYVLELIVTDGEGVVSTPVVVPVEVSLRSVKIKNVGLVDYIVSNNRVNVTKNLIPEQEVTYYCAPDDYFAFSQNGKPTFNTSTWKTLDAANVVLSEQVTVYDPNANPPLEATHCEVKTELIDLGYTFTNSSSNPVVLQDYPYFQHSVEPAEVYNIYTPRTHSLQPYGDFPFKLMNGVDLIEVAVLDGATYFCTPLDNTLYPNLIVLDV